MAGIYIPGMVMPKSCAECQFCLEDAMCAVLCEDLFDYLDEECTRVSYLPDDWKPDDCPLIPVPKHGDLIDRDKLRKKEFVIAGDAYAVVMSRDIRNAPTIIPADKEDEDG